MVFATGLTLTCVRPCPLLSWSVRVLSPPQQKGFVITSTPPHTTMVATRSTFASTGSGAQTHASPAPMVAASGDDLGDSVQQQHQPSPREQQLAALRLQELRQAAAIVDVQLDSAKKDLARLSPRVGAAPRVEA